MLECLPCFCLETSDPSNEMKYDLIFNEKINDYQSFFFFCFKST